jgi:hypothetical protein
VFNDNRNLEFHPKLMNKINEDNHEGIFPIHMIENCSQQVIKMVKIVRKNKRGVGSINE